jgi:penicillin-binding protein 1C
MPENAKFNQLNRKHYFLLIFAILFIFLFYRFITILPEQLFTTPYSTVITDADGELLAAIIASDGQWRFPAGLEVPDKFAACIIEFEDASFFIHNGVNPQALVKAAYRNIQRRRFISGGSTITMQLIRLSRKGQARTVKEKLIEMILAIRLEYSYSKKEILELYASQAPFGGNVVGLEAASWRYFGIEPEQLSWGQAATLAVLPNSPSLVYPGKNDTLLLNKRNKLLKKLFDNHYFPENVYQMAISEPLPRKPYPLPDDGIHILNRAISDNMQGMRIHTTIRKDIQSAVQELVNKHVAQLMSNKIENAAAIVIEVQTGNILAYVGNSTLSESQNHQVDMLSSRRSPGSTLKPLLYCAMLHEGMILPNTLMPDIPMIMDGFQPQNYLRTFDGAVPASQALSRSLNVPAVHMLKQFGVQKFHSFLKKAGITTLTKPSSHYGLSLILGGAEVRPDELAGVYASMARILLRYTATEKYDNADIFPPKYCDYNNQLSEANVFTDAASIWFALKAMVEVNRPDEDQFWYHFSSKNPVAWKTGTSYGERDAWAIGITPAFVVGVWAGNSSGEGRPGLTGVRVAAPLMFDIFNILPPSGWFREPFKGMIQTEVCSNSGFKASQYCNLTYVESIPAFGIRSSACPYHQLIHLDSTLRYQVHADCENIEKIISQKRFVLPPVMEHYYRIKNPAYAPLPPWREDCAALDNVSNFGIIYPVSGSRIYLIHELTGEEGKVVFRATHRKHGSILYWHLDDDFIGTTKGKHTLALSPPPGKHRLTVVDNHGEIKTISFEILNRER